MATQLATGGLPLASRGRPSCAASCSSYPPSSPQLGRRPSGRFRCSSPQVDAAAAAPPGKGGEYRPSFADDLLLAFFRSKMVEVLLCFGAACAWALICTWSQILKTIAASSTSGCRLHLLILTKPSRNRAWTSAQMRGGAESSEEIVAQMCSVAPKFDVLIVKDCTL